MAITSGVNATSLSARSLAASHPVTLCQLVTRHSMSSRRQKRAVACAPFMISPEDCRRDGNMRVAIYDKRLVTRTGFGAVINSSPLIGRVLDLHPRCAPAG